MQALRLTLLGMVARVLDRWLTSVTARLEPAAPEASASPADPRQPPPPDHWVELVRQHAPQLLERDTAGDAAVIEWRADDAPPPRAAPPPPPRSAPIPARQPARAKRPLRLEHVSAQNLDAQAVNQPASGFTPSAHPLDVSLTNPPDAPLVMPPRRSTDAPAQPVRAVATPPTSADPVAPHYADLPFERTSLRETNASLPEAASIPTIRTSAGRAAQPNQQRTSIPGAPAQIVMRPTSTPLPLNGEAIPSDRWAALPDLPADEPRDAAFERQRRERLKREQEGRAWSE